MELNEASFLLFVHALFFFILLSIFGIFWSVGFMFSLAVWIWGVSERD